MGSNGYNGKHMSSHQKTLDQALDEIDRWSEPMVRDLEGLSPDELCEYFKRVPAEFTQKLGRPLLTAAQIAQRYSLRPAWAKKL
jgi:hypothetical protein